MLLRRDRAMTAVAMMLDSVRGPHGGYRLARPCKEPGLAEIAGAVTDPAADVAVTGLQATVVQPLWNELDALCRVQLAGLGIDDLVKRAVATGQRPSAGPVSFAMFNKGLRALCGINVRDI